MFKTMRVRLQQNEIFFTDKVFFDKEKVKKFPFQENMKRKGHEKDQ